MRALIAAVCGLMIVTGCKRAKVEDQPNASATAQASRKPSRPAPLDKWEEFRFGMSFDNAITAASGVEWDAEDFQKCRNEIPVKGCSLSADPARSYRPTFAGMELLPTLEFNEDAQLTDVELRRIYGAGVTPKQCEAMHARLLDYLTTKYGQGQVNEGGLVMRSPGGNIYHRSEQVNPVMVAGIEDFRTATDGSNISLLTTFTAGSPYSE